MTRPRQFEEHRYLGDKRSLVVYDLDLLGTVEGLDELVDELVVSERFAAFSPDTLPEARNRGYHPHRSIREAADAQA